MFRRRLAGWLMVCALTLSYAEALTAAACSMGTSTDMAMDMSMPESGGDHEKTPAGHPVECPLSIPGSPANCIFSSAVAPAVEAIVIPRAVQKLNFTALEDHYQLLLDHSPFHPPKA